MANHRKVCQAVGCVTKAQNGYRGYCKACLRKKFPKLYVEKQKKRRIQDKKNRKMKQKKLGIQAGGSGSRVNCKRESQKLVGTLRPKNLPEICQETLLYYFEGELIKMLP